MKKKLIIFDLDGVIINSKKNMCIAWEETSKEFNLNIKFSQYFKFLGLSFSKILKSLSIYKNHEKIKSHYSKVSVKNFNKITLYPGVKKILNYLKKSNYLCIVTSKDKYRTKKIIDYFNLNFDLLSSPEEKLRSKPWPDQINKCIKKFKSLKKDTIYIGDTYFDYLAARRAGINFIFASYGYGYKNKIYKTKVNSISDLRKYL